MSECSGCSDILFFRYIYRYKDVHPESGTLSEMLFLYLKKEQEEINRKTNLLFI